MAEGSGSTPLVTVTWRAYVLARTIALVCLTLIVIVAFLDPARYDIPILLVGYALMLALTVAEYVALKIRHADAATVLSWIAAGDSLALGFLIIALSAFADPVYPAVISVSIFYAFVIRRREAILISFWSALIYVAAHVIAGYPTDPHAVLYLILKTLALLVVGGVAVTWADRFTRKEEEDEEIKAEHAALNDQLQRRLAELQAVSQITDIIHSSLDFDRVGPLTLEILSKVIGIESCALFVIDRRKSETLFSASLGIGEADVSVNADSVNALETISVSSGHFSCISILNHEQMMVIFCAESDVIDSMVVEDRLVLQAVASELVVAVDNSRLYKLTRTLAITDELTGLFNYRYLQQRLDEEIERARRYHKDLSLLMIDADDFKLFNDEYGHIAGDHALADLAHVLKTSTREVDVVARYGGEEFSIILPETDAAGAFVVAEKIREAVAEHPFKDIEDAPARQVTISVGLATFPTHAKDKETLLRLADDALYQAKSGGKNKVRSPMLDKAGRDTAMINVQQHEEE